MEPSWSLIVCTTFLSCTPNWYLGWYHAILTFVMIQSYFKSTSLIQTPSEICLHLILYYGTYCLLFQGVSWLLMTYTSKYIAGANSHTLIPLNGSVPRNDVSNLIALIVIFRERIQSMTGLLRSSKLHRIYYRPFSTSLPLNCKVMTSFTFSVAPCNLYPAEGLQYRFNSVSFLYLT